LAAGVITTACTEEHKAAAPRASAVISAADQALLEELVDVSTPLQKTVTSDVTDKRFVRRLELLAELSSRPPQVGQAALAELQRRTEPVQDVEQALLRVAAKCDPEGTAELLANLATEYGPSLFLRTEALLLLGETAPRRALEVLRPWIGNARPGRTLPPQEFIVKAWVDACDGAGRSPVPELCDVATNLLLDGASRVRAVKELGRRPDPAGEKALRSILVESTGDGYLRRKAAQALRDSLPEEAACEVFRQIADREADPNMLRFLIDMLEEHCEG
jgi:HEAT repeat protein